MSRGSTAPVISRRRSARVDFPWSMWAMMLRQRIRLSSVKGSILAAGGAIGSGTGPAASLLSGFQIEQQKRAHVANIKSQKKRNRQNERRRERNKAVRSELKTRVKVATTAVETGAEDAEALVQAAQKRLGKAGVDRASSTRTRPPGAPRA